MPPDSVTPSSERLVDPETGETPPLSPSPIRAEILVLVIDPRERDAYIEGSLDHVQWEPVEPNDAA